MNNHWFLGALISIAAWALPLGALGAPLNDNFASATLVTGGTGTALGSNFGATREPNEPYNVSVFGDASVWWRWTAPEDGPFTFETHNSNFDTVLGVYTGNSVDALTRVVANDHDQSPGDTSGVTFYAQKDTTYRISVSGFNGETGSVSLKWRPASPPANDDFANGAAPLSGSSGTVQGSNLEATSEGDEPLHAESLVEAITEGLITDAILTDASVWWSWTPQDSGAVFFDTAGSDFWTVLGVYTGSTLDQLTEVAASTDVNTQRAIVGFWAEAGTTYRIAVAGLLGERGDLVDLEWGVLPPPANDDFANRAALVEAAVLATNIAATREPGEPEHAGQTTVASVWWSWTAPKSGTFVFNTDGSDFDTVLAVYTGSDVTGLTEVASNDDASGANETSQVTFNAQAGATYQIAVAGSGDDRGTLVLRWGEGVNLSALLGILNLLLD